MICPQCQSENRDSAKFCDECGARLVEPTPEVVEDVKQEIEPEDNCVDEQPEELIDACEDAEANQDASEDVDAMPNESEGIAADQEQATEEAPAEAKVDLKEFDFGDIGQSDPLKGLDVASPIFFDVTKLDLPSVDSTEVTREIPPVAESVVGEGYRAPESAWRSGGTMEMPRAESKEAPAKTDFRAPDPNDKKRRRKEAKELRKSQKAAEKAMMEAQGIKSNKSKAPLVVALVAICALVIAGSTYYLELWGGKTVVDCSGKTEADAVYLLQNEGFTVRVDTVPSDDTEGLVLLTDPSAGTRTEKGSEVVVHVATSRTIPDVIMKSEEEARALLAKSGYDNISVTYEKSDDYDNKVTSISPDKGSKAKSSAKITMTVAQSYVVPSVEGLTEYEAVAAVQDAGYQVYVNYVENNTIAEGYAVSTNPAGGEKVRSDTAITLNVSQAKATRLQAAAKDYLASVGTITLGVTSYQIVSVDSVSYAGSNKVSFSITGRPYTSFLGETIYLSERQVTGTISFDDNDKVISVS